MMPAGSSMVLAWTTNPILLDQQKLLISGHCDNDGHARRVGALGVFPVAFLYERQESAGVERGFHKKSVN
jgi:hypothetical protein